MSFDLPPNIEPQVQEYAKAQHLSENDALIRLVQAGLMAQKVHFGNGKKPHYSAMFGAVKKGYGSKDAIDNAISELRDAW